MADDLIPSQIIILSSIVGGLICIALSSIPVVGGIFSIIATILGVICGTNTLRHIGKYSLGTGVPSIVYMLTAAGLVSMICGVMISRIINQNLLYPIFSMIIALIIAFVISLMCTHIFKIQVEILRKSFITLTIATVISIIGMSTLIVSSSDIMLIYSNVIKNGLIIILMILSVMAIQNPYNSCMGPNEDQYRTLSLSLSTAFLMLIIISIISILNSSYWYIYIIISIIGWLVSFKLYIKYTKQQAALIKWSGLWPNNDEGGI